MASTLTLCIISLTHNLKIKLKNLIISPQIFPTHIDMHMWALTDIHTCTWESTHTHTHLCTLLSPCVYVRTLLHVVINVHTFTNTLHTYTHTNISLSTKLTSYWCFQPMFIHHISIFYSSIYRIPKYFWFFRSVSMRSHPRLNNKLCVVRFVSIQLPAPFWLELFVLAVAIFQFTSQQLHVNTKLLACMPSLKAFLWNPKVSTFNASWTWESCLVEVFFIKWPIFLHQK